jgi:hypothetical protein
MPKPLTIESSTLHIALATYPKRQADEYIKAVKKTYRSFKTDFSDNYQGNSQEINAKGLKKKPKTDHTYEPLVYHIFGSYDVAFITVIDSYKFAQKLFLPKENDIANERDFNPNSYQILTGLCPQINPDFELKNLYDKNINKTFVNICNIKLNNGFLIGNGIDLFSLVMEYIDCRIREFKGFTTTDPCCYDYILLQSFSWFEICLTLFDDSIEPISKIITTLRGTTLEDLIKYNPERGLRILKNSLYWESGKGGEDNIRNSHIFADTHSHFGVKYERFIKKTPFNKDGEDFILSTDIEFLVKPGHIGDLIEDLEKIKDSDGNCIFNTEESFFITGKSDYIIPEKLRISFENNHKLFLKLRDSKSTLMHYIRSIKTRPLFTSHENSKPNKQKGLLHFSDYLNAFSIKMTSIQKIDENLKKLKVSRPIRQKISKVLFNYNNGINDPVLFLYFLDFKILMTQLEILVQDETYNFTQQINRNNEDLFKPVSEIEEKLEILLKVFEEGFHVRMLNCYQFEEIYDFDLDLNSSLSQLLTTYNTLVTEVTNIHIPGYSSGQVVQVNLQNTVSNFFSINYNVYHLALPEFVLFTITKEIFNPMREIKSFNGFFYELDNLVKNDADLQDLVGRDLLDTDYIINDIIRIIYVCNFDMKLNDFWLWTDALQTSSQYDSLGAFREKPFTVMLFRIMLIASFFDPAHIDDMTCPIPELSSYWFKYFSEYKKKVESVMKKQNFVDAISNICKKIINVSHLQKEIPISTQLSWVSTDDCENKIENIISNFKVFTEKDSELSAKFRIKIHNQYAFFEKFKGEIIDGNNLFFESDETNYLKKHHFIYGLAYTYLRIIFDHNDGKIYFLRRNWEDGVIHEYFKNNNQQLYTIDPMGGVFFFDKEKATKYYKMRNAVLESLWDFALIAKKDFIKHHFQLLEYGKNEKITMVE